VWNSENKERSVGVHVLCEMRGSSRCLKSVARTLANVCAKEALSIAGRFTNSDVIHDFTFFTINITYIYRSKLYMVEIYKLPPTTIK
jgi:hypothetical protein